METRKKQVSKTGRVTVPFYNPPTRVYGQTPSEIIREARASVMNMPTTGIKPVSTNRPYTPKEKERILFGNVKRRLSRPPSAFSLSYLQRPEALPRVKLPAIQTPTQKKIGHNTGVRSAQSLDNLPEDYESETLEDSEFDMRVLPLFQKSGMRPPDKKMSRAITLTGNLLLKTPERREFSVSQPYIDVVSSSSDDIYTDYSEETRKQPDIQSKSSQPSKRCLTQKVSDSEYEDTNLELPPSSESLTSFEKASSVIEPQLPCQPLESTKKGEKEEICKSKPFENNTEEMQSVDRAQIKKFTKTLPQPNETENSLDKGQYCAVNGESRDSIISNSGADTGTKAVSQREKSVATEIIPEYLSLVNNGPRHTNANNCSISKEIHELYETASYYGVFSNRKTDGTSKEQPAIESEVNETNCGKDHFKEEEKTFSNSDYLNILKENIKNFDIKMKNLSANIESFEEKLSGSRKIYSQTQIVADASDISTFKMNNNVKHRKTSENKHITYRKYFNDVENLVSPKKESETVGWDGFWKNSYYKQKAETDNSTPDQEHSFLEDYLARLTEINNETLTDAESKEIVHITSEMYKLLKKGYLIRKYTDENEIKIKILRSVYKFAENEYPEILLNLARIIFMLKLENSLSAACKMVFKVARSDANDHLFLELDDILDLFLDGIGLASPLDEGECCIYGYGALKFLTMNHRILSKLISLGALDLMILHLKIISSAKLEGVTVKEQTQYALFQLTGALRNIAAGDGALPLFITTNSIPVLCKILHHFRQCDDIVTNISRILSQLSADEDVTQILMSVENILGTIIELLEQFKSNYKILVRLSYCLGNIMAYSDKARVQLSRSETHVTTLIRILQFYVDKDLDFFMKKKMELKTESEQNEDGGVDNDIIDDIIVKVIRIIANMCMNPVVGSNLSPNEDNEENSLKLSHLLATLLQRKDPGITLLACLGCLNNISYYCSNHSSLIDITEGTIRVLGLHDEECKAEAARVLGNLTRHETIRGLICSTGGIHRLTKLLDSNDKDVYKSACGALVNLMLDYDTRKIFVESHGIDKLTEGLERFSGDWIFAGLICRAIWNSCADDMAAVTSHNDLEKLVTILASSLDEENWNDGDPVWEEFALLATDLLEKINAYMEVT